MLFGNKVRELREERGLLLREVAALLEVDTATVSKIELGIRSIKKEQIKPLADVLDADADELHTLWLANKVYMIIEGDKKGIEASKIAIELLKIQMK